MPTTIRIALAAVFLASLSATATADENLFGYVRGAEPLPKEAVEFYAIATSRQGKGEGDYSALDFEAELEYGATDKLAVSGKLIGLGIDTSGLTIDGYLPKDEKYSLRFSGADASIKYNFLTPAHDSVGLATYTSLTYLTLDPHSGQDKDTLSFEQILLLQKYFLEGQMILAGNLALEATRAERAPIEDLPEGFDWPTEPEMEIEINAGAGLSYRFLPNWFVGAEAFYSQENETEVGLERWSLQAGPSLHYGGAKWWATLTWLPQIKGGGETYPGQEDTDLHLVEKTQDEYRLKFGLNF
ncbi:MAG: DUF6662 family protein [Povalibacter sp.]